MANKIIFKSYWCKGTILNQKCLISQAKSLSIMKEQSSFVIFPIFGRNFIIPGKVCSRPHTKTSSKITAWFSYGAIKSIFLFIK